MSQPRIKTGLGLDAHAFAENRTLILGGVLIPYEKGLMGHSDADVLCHAMHCWAQRDWGTLGSIFQIPTLSTLEQAASCYCNVVRKRCASRDMP